MASNNGKTFDLYLRQVSKMNSNVIELQEIIENKQNINESIHQNYDHFEEVIDSQNEDNYDSNESQLISKDMIIKDN
jgi:hypothetical protein